MQAAQAVQAVQYCAWLRVRALCGRTRDARVRPPGPDGLAGRGVGRHTPVRTRVKAVHVLVSDGS